MQGRGAHTFCNLIRRAKSEATAAARQRGLQEMKEERNGALVETLNHYTANAEEVLNPYMCTLYGHKYLYSS